MNLIFVLYAICLFVIFTPGIFFSILNKNNVKNIMLHGVIFTVILYVSYCAMSDKIIEGNTTYSVNFSDLSNLFDTSSSTSNCDVKSEIGLSAPDNQSEEVKMAKKTQDAVNRVKKEISGETKTLGDNMKKQLADMKKELTDYKFDAKKAKFVCTMELPNYDFSKPSIDPNSYNYYTSKTLVPGWSLERAALLNNSQPWGFKTPYPDGSQAIALQNTANISTIVQLYEGSYILKFYVSGRDCCDKSGIANELDLMINDKVFDTLTPEVGEWDEYKSKPFSIDVPGQYIITIQGKNKEEINGVIDKSSAVKNIVIHRE